MANRHQRRMQAATGATAEIRPAGAGEKVASDVHVSLFNVPSFYASGLQVATIANDVIITFNAAQVGQAQVSGEMQNVARFSPVANVTVSIMTLKEVLGAIQSVVHQYEAEYGEITTPFLQGQMNAR